MNKGLLSVHRMVEVGNRVVFQKSNHGVGGYVEDAQTRGRMYMRSDHGMFMLKLWAKKAF